jgi:bacterioferritin
MRQPWERIYQDNTRTQKLLDHVCTEEHEMKGNENLLKTLNSLLSDELTAISQYMVHSEMCDNWGYEKLHKAFEKRAIDEMKHAEKLIARILFLEAKPVVDKLGRITIGGEVSNQLANDLALETGAIGSYNKAIALAAEVGDNATKDMLQHILEDEDGHVNGIEEKQDQISQMGVQMFLAMQVG